MSVQAPEVPLGWAGPQAGEEGGLPVAHAKPAPAERPAGAGAIKAASHLGKKLALFPATGRINPLSQPDERPCTAAAASVPHAQPCEPAAARVPWDELPPGVLERVLLHVRRAADAEAGAQPGCGAAARRAWLRLLYGPYSVCREWRQAGLCALFSGWWGSGHFSHPSQCLYLAPEVGPQLLRCHIVRERARGCTCLRLFQGAGPEAPDARFLLAAMLGRTGCQLCFCTQPARLPFAKRLPTAQLASGLLRSAYSLELCPYGAAQLGTPHGSPACHQAAIGYQTRILSCLRPRRMAVALSGSNAAPLHARLWPDAAAEGAAPAQPAAAPSPASSRCCCSPPALLLLLGQCCKHAMAACGEEQKV